MKRNQMSLWVLITSMLLLTGFKKNTGVQNIREQKTTNSNSSVNSFAELPEVNISDQTVIQIEKEQKTAKVLICLSHASTEPVTMEYTTENGTAIAGVSYATSKGSIKFEPGEIAKWVTVSILAGVAADPDEDATVADEEDFHLILQNVKGAIVKKIKAIIKIIKNISRDPRFSKEQSIYEVKFSFKGYTSLGPNRNDYPVNTDGQVNLDGLLAGIDKNVPDSIPISYIGTLTLAIDKMGICTVDRRRDGTDVFCAMVVNGVGQVTTELEIDTSAGYGYIKINYDPTRHGQFFKSVDGDCFEQAGEEKGMVPNESISSIFNGLELDMLVDVASGKPLRTLKKGVYTQTDKEGNVTTVEVVRKIR